MELRHLRYFVAIGEDQHYGRAARRLRVAQPALYRQIQALEEEIGFKLFERLPRGVKLSAAGKYFLEDARRILREVNDAVARTARVASGLSGTLRVGQLYVPELVCLQPTTMASSTTIPIASCDHGRPGHMGLETVPQSEQDAEEAVSANPLK